MKLFMFLGVPALLALNLCNAATEEAFDIEGNLLAKVPDFSAWRITFSYRNSGNANQQQGGDAPSGGASGDSTLPKQVDIVITKPVWRAISSFIGGGKLEQWASETGRFVIEKGRLSQMGLMDPRTPNYSTVFPTLNWVSKQTYVGQQAVGSVKCMVFRTKIEGDPDAEANGDTVVWIDMQSRFPVRWEHNGEVRAFQQLPAPTATLILPADVQRESDAKKRDRERLNMPVPHAMLRDLSIENMS